MAKLRLLLGALVACIVHAAAATTNSNNSTLDSASATVYDVLAQNNLPRGLIPKGVQSYVLQAGSALKVTLPGDCNFFVTFAGKQFKFRYGSSVGGVIKSGSISAVHGMSMQVAFAWLGFNKVERVGDTLVITLGPGLASQSLPVSVFAQSPSCG